MTLADIFLACSCNLTVLPNESSHWLLSGSSETQAKAVIFQNLSHSTPKIDFDKLVVLREGLVFITDSLEYEQDIYSNIGTYKAPPLGFGGIDRINFKIF